MKYNTVLIVLSLLFFLPFEISAIDGPGKYHQLQSFITFEQFGALGNGSDETQKLLTALQYARQQKKGVRLSGGKTYKFSPSQPVDITGIPFFDGHGKFDLTGVGETAGNPSIRSVFVVTGKKQLLQSAAHGLRAGSRSLNLNPGLDLAAGNIIFITSTEALPNNKRRYNRRGQRAVVESYNSTSGRLTIKDSFHFTISSAWFWKNTVKPRFQVGDSLSFVTLPMNMLSCFQFVYADAKVSGSYLNFALAAIYFRSSEGEVSNARIELPISSNNGYSYGVAISDMSDVTVRNASITGGRHTVCITSGGLWRANETGGSTNEALGYPAIGKIEGGVYKGSYVDDVNENLGTLDSHGSAYYMFVNNCSIYGPVSLGAMHGLIQNCTIYTDNKRAFNIGSDVEAGSDWGEYIVSNSTIQLDRGNSKSVFFGKAAINQLSISHVKIIGNSETTLIADFKDQPPVRIDIDRLLLAKEVRSPKLWINSKSRVSIKRSSVGMDKIKLIDR